MTGKVLVVGIGTTVWPKPTPKFFDPATGGWTDTAGFNTPRAAARMTLLPNGKVLLVGGMTYSSGYPDSTELYDPAAGTWTVEIP